jgi:hypothetical protein
MAFWTDPPIMFFGGSFGFAWRRGQLAKWRNEPRSKSQMISIAYAGAINLRDPSFNGIPAATAARLIGSA